MPDASLTLLGALDDAAVAIEQLKARGVRLRSRGLKTLGAAAIALAVSVVALVLNLNAAPITEFTSIDLPVLDSTTAAVRSSQGSSLDNASAHFESIAVSLVEGHLLKVLVVVGLVLGGILAVSSGNPFPALMSVFMASAMFFVPTLLGAVRGESSAPLVRSDGNTFLAQIAEDRRYDDLSAAVAELMPSAAAAYVKAQIAYLTQRHDVLKGELESLRAANFGKLTPDPARMNVLETTAYGAPTFPATIQFITVTNDRIDTYSTVFNAATMAAIGFFIFGTAPLVLGLVLLRRSRRLKVLMGPGRTSAHPGAQRPAAPEDSGARPALAAASSTTEPSAWTPAWQRPPSTWGRSTVTSRTTSPGAGASDDGLLGLGMVAVAGAADSVCDSGGDGGSCGGGD